MSLVFINESECVRYWQPWTVLRDHKADLKETNLCHDCFFKAQLPKRFADLKINISDTENSIFLLCGGSRRYFLNT